MDLRWPKQVRSQSSYLCHDQGNSINPFCFLQDFSGKKMGLEHLICGFDRPRVDNFYLTGHFIILDNKLVHNSYTHNVRQLLILTLFTFTT